MTRAATLLIALAVFTAVLAYLTLALPRLSSLRALFATAGLGALLLAVVVLLSPAVVTAPLMGLTALFAGHLGWWLGRQSRRRHRRNRSRSPGTRRRAPAAAYRDEPGARRAPGGTAAARAPDAGPDQAVPAADPSPLPPPATSPLPAPSAGAAGAEAAPAASPTLASHALPMADLQRTQLGRYRIDRAIGRGAMGAVYLGLDPVLGRQVAIKTMALGREFDGTELEEAKQRFFREAETAGRLQHRDIVTIYDAGEDQDLAYIAMEFLKGHDLQRHTSPGQLLPVPTVLRIGARVADALAYAHSQGVIHRDVKPANVMLHQPSGSVKVSDFGIARITDAARTRTGMVLGTPSFMAPEHLAGQRIDGRADLYALGVMLFQLLTGRLPFQADSMAKLMNAIANDAAPDVRSLRPELSPEVAGVLARAMAKSPASRPADGALMAAELRAAEAAEGPPRQAEAEAAASAGPAADTPAGPYDATVRLARSDSGHNPQS